MRLAGKVAIVTGSSRGFGKHLAKLFASEGAAVVVTARTQGTGGFPGSITETVNEISAGGGRSLALRCDLSLEEDVRRLVGATLDAYGQIDIVVNNAVVRAPTKLLDTTLADMEWVLKVNLLGALALCRHAVPSMMARRRGSIISIRSSDI